MSMTAPTVQEFATIAEAVKRPQWEVIAPAPEPQRTEYRIQLAPDCYLNFRTGTTDMGQPFAGVSLTGMGTCAHYFGEHPERQRENLLRQLREKLSRLTAGIADVIGEQVPC